MGLGWLLALQKAAELAPAMLAPIDFDIANVKPPEPACGGDRGGGEIVVCGRRLPAQRFWPNELHWTEDSPRGLGRAALDLGGGANLGLLFSPAAYPGGGTSNRIMVTLHFKF